MSSARIELRAEATRVLIIWRGTRRESGGRKASLIFGGPEGLEHGHQKCSLGPALFKTLLSHMGALTGGWTYASGPGGEV